MKSSGVTIQIKAIEQCFIVLFKVVLACDCVHEILKCVH